MAKHIDNYQLITDRIIELLEQGVVPWRRPWAAGIPANLKSGRDYRGINTFLLSCTGHESPHWVTFKQAQSMGGSVRKGERGFPVIFWKLREKVDKATGETSVFPLLRRYTVFNAAAQCDGLDVPPVLPKTLAWSPLDQAEAIVDGFASRPTIQYGGGRACYYPTLDKIGMPPREAFEDRAEYYSTLFHELGHSSGHASRLGRPGVTDLASFGSHSYSQEELVAEMTSAFLCGACGIEQQTLDNSAAYIGSWLSKLRNDKRLVIQAGAQAQRAADLIYGTTFESSDASTDSAELSTAA